MLNFIPSLIIPELYMAAVLIALFAQTVTDKIKDKTDWLVYASLGGVLVAALSMDRSGMMFYDSYQIDRLSQFFKLVVVLGLAICVLNALRNNSLGKANRADYFFFMFMSAFGLMLLASTVELFTLYISLELASYSLYILLPLRNDNPQAVEGAVKYALFGAVATAIGLFGVSYIIAGQHTTYLHELAAMNWSFSEQPMALVGLALFSLAFLYKLALFPFHFWAPDVYQGASNETAAFAATLPKVGAIVVLVRLMSLEPGVEIKVVLAVFATLSMTLGNLLALRQTDLKRLLAYSSIAHAGFVVMGLVAGGAYGLAAASYYALVYVIMNLTIFWVIARLADDGRNIQLHDLKGLHRSSPLLAFVLAVAAFGLVGLPPTGGFTGKLFLLNAAWGAGFHLLVIIAALNTALAIFYYLNMVRHAYTMEQDYPSSIQGTMVGATVALALALGVLFLGLMPQGLFDMLLQASNALLL